MTAQQKPKSALRICHINLNSFRTKRSQLLELIKDHDIDILTLNETKLLPNSTASLPGFDLIRRDHTSQSGGLAIASRQSLLVQHVPLPNNPHQALLASVTLPNQRPFHIATLHTSPFDDTHPPILTHLSSTYPRLLIAADLNCHHQALGDRTTTPPGTLLARSITASRLCHHPTPYTRFPLKRTERPTYPDKLLTTADLSSSILTVTSGYDIGSDHIPLLIDLKVRPYPYKLDNHPTRLIQDYRNANWALYCTTITDILTPNLTNPPPDSPDQIEFLNQTITNAILDAKTLAVPTKTVIHTPNQFPPDTISLIKAKRRARRLLLRDPGSPYLHDVYRHLVQRVKYAVRAYHEDRMDRVCSKAETDFHSDSKPLWKLVKSFNNPNTPSAPLIVDGLPVTDSDSKAEIFRNHLENTHSEPNHPDFDQHHLDTVNQTVAIHHALFTPYQSLPAEMPDHALLQPITVLEVSGWLKTLKNTAPGPDGISNLLLKKAPPTLLSALTQLYNSVLLLGYCPQPWKHAHVLLFPKPFKNPRDPNNYRPISLTSSISKLFEKVLTRRLHVHLNSLNLIPSTQAGFRPGFNMHDQIIRVVTCLQDRTQRGLPTLLALMDVRKAFDTVWHNGLRAKLLDLHLPPSILKWISGFIDGRTAQVRIRENLSTPFTLHAGVPQGSAISPLLYILFVRDVPSPTLRHPSDTTRGLAQFADDTVFWFSHRQTNTLTNQLTQILTDYLTYCNMWRIRLNTDKTQLCYFGPGVTGRRRYRQFQRNPIILNGTRLNLTTSCVYLGVTLDSGLTFHPHLKKAKKSASTRLRALRILNNRHQGCSSRLLTRLYTSTVRPALTFGHQLFHTPSDSVIESMEQTERKAMRLASHLPPWTSNADIYEHFTIPTLRDHINHLNHNYITRLHNSQILRPFLTNDFVDREELTLNHLLNLEL